VLHGAMGASSDAQAWWVLVLWALIAPLAATRLFRFDG